MNARGAVSIDGSCYFVVLRSDGHVAMTANLQGNEFLVLHRHGTRKGAHHLVQCERAARGDVEALAWLANHASVTLASVTTAVAAVAA